MAEVVKSFQEALSRVENSQSRRGTTLHTNQLQDRDLTPERLETSQALWKHIPPLNLSESGYPSEPTRTDDKENLGVQFSALPPVSHETPLARPGYQGSNNQTSYYHVSTPARDSERNYHPDIPVSTIREPEFQRLWVLTILLRGQLLFKGHGYPIRSHDFLLTSIIVRNMDRIVHLLGN